MSRAKKIIILIQYLIVFTILQISANDKVISGEFFYASFRGMNYYVYKPTMGINLEFKKGLIFGAGIMNFKTRHDIFYVADNSPIGYFTMSYKNYLVIPFYVGSDFTINVTRQFKINPGFQFGWTIVNYECDSNDLNGEFDENYQGGKIAFAPRLKFCFETNENISIYLNAKYNGMFEIKGLNDNGSHAAGAYHHYITFGLGVEINLH